jgi:choline dehydrogenase-like flavoprotein
MNSWNNETDVVVLGSGAAGLTAALTAAAHGASVEVYEKAPSIGGTSAVSGGIVWIPAHRRLPEQELTVNDAMSYLHAQSLGSMDEDLVETFVRTGPEMLDFVEAHSDIEFEIAAGFPDYKPELPGGRPAGGRSLNAVPYDLSGSAIGPTGSRRFPPTSAMSGSTLRRGRAFTRRLTTHRGRWPWRARRSSAGC